jgi:hypothetical protein
MVRMSKKNKSKQRKVRSLTFVHISRVKETEGKKNNYRVQLLIKLMKRKLKNNL